MKKRYVLPLSSSEMYMLRSKSHRTNSDSYAKGLLFLAGLALLIGLATTL